MWNVSGKGPYRNNHLEDLSVGGSMILKWTMKKGVERIDLPWDRQVTGCCAHSKEYTDSVKCSIPLLAKKLSASQERLGSKELVINYKLY